MISIYNINHSLISNKSIDQIKSIHQSSHSTDPTFCTGRLPPVSGPVGRVGPPQPGHISTSAHSQGPHVPPSPPAPQTEGFAERSGGARCGGRKERHGEQLGGAKRQADVRRGLSVGQMVCGRPRELKITIEAIPIVEQFILDIDVDIEGFFFVNCYILF